MSASGAVWFDFGLFWACGSGFGWLCLIQWIALRVVALLITLCALWHLRSTVSFITHDS